MRQIVEVDGHEAFRREQLPSDGWLAYSVNTSRFAGTLRTVTFKVLTPDERQRHFTFTAWARE